MINLAIAGAAGRMGGALIRAAVADGMRITAAIEHADSAALGRDAGALAGIGELGVPVSAELDREFDLLLEFTTPAATLAHLPVCRQLRRGMLIGTTGLDAAATALIRAAAADIPIVLAANTSVGVNLCVSLVDAAAAVLGEISDIEIIEAHHRHKVDAPSGTALLLARAAADRLGKDLDRDSAYHAPTNATSGARTNGSIGFASVRGGDIVGEHSVLFIGDGERVEITHKATDRKIFATGALKAATWLASQPPGLYDMRDVLGLK